MFIFHVYFCFHSTLICLLMFTAAPKSSCGGSESDDEIEESLTIDEADGNGDDEDSNYKKNMSRLSQADVPSNPKNFTISSIK